jgi:hypothetical protein
MSVPLRVPSGLECVADADAARPLDASIDAEVDRLAVPDSAIASDEGQGVEVTPTGLRVASRDGAAWYGPADLDNGLAQPKPPALPGVFFVGPTAGHFEEHPEAPRVDRAARSIAFFPSERGASLRRPFASD